MKTEKKANAEKTPKTPKASKASKDSKGSEVIGTNKPNPEASAKFDNGDGTQTSTKIVYPSGHASLADVTTHSLALSMETSMLRELTKGLLSTLISTQKK